MLTVPVLASRWERSGVAYRWAFGLAVAAVGAFRMWRATIQPAFWKDSESYQQVAQAPMWSSDFWIGVRPPGLPLLWKLTGSPAGYVRVQVVLAVAGWAWLAWVVGRSMRSRMAGSVASVVVLLFSCTGPIVIWDRSVLTEALSLAVIALLYGLLFEASRAVSWRWLVRFGLVVAAGVALRDSQIVVVVLLGIGTALVAWRGSLDRERRRFAAYAAVVALLIGLVAGQVASDSGRLTQNVAGVFAVRVFPFPDRVAWFADHGMPQAAQISAKAKTTKGVDGDAKAVQVSPFDAAFAPLFDWLIHDGQSAYQEWLLTHPGYVVGEPLHRPEHSFNIARGHLSRYDVADGVDLHLAWLFWPAWPVVLAEAVGVAALLAWRRMWRSRLVWAVAGLAVLGLAAILAAWHADGQETSRHVIEGQAQVRLGLLLLLLIALGRGAPLRRRPVAESGDGPRDEAGDQPADGSSSSMRLPNGSST